MTTETQIAALMDEANPVPDLEAYQVDVVEVATYLANLEQRSNEVTQLDTKKKNEGVKTSSKWTWIAAAAAFVAGISLAVVFSDQLGGDTASSGGEAGQIAFAVTIPDEQAPLFAANGPAVDAGLICGTAIGRWLPGEVEDAEGNVLTVPVEVLLNMGTPHVIADVFSMTCDDGSGQFTLRIFGEVDPSDPDWSVETADAWWTITAGAGNEGLSGEGVASGEQTRNAITVKSGSGSVTADE